MDFPFSQAEINQAIDSGCMKFEREMSDVLYHEHIINLYFFSDDFYKTLKFSDKIKTISEEMT